MTAAVLTRSGRLGWVAWRQHRPGLLAVLVLFGLTAAVMAVTGLDPKWHAIVLNFAWRYQLYPLMTSTCCCFRSWPGWYLARRCWLRKLNRARCSSRGHRASARSRW